MTVSAKSKRKHDECSTSSKAIQSPQAETSARAASPIRLRLEPGQVVYFRGRAEVQCKSGAVWLQGTHLEKGSPGVCICADLEAGGLLPIQALPSDTQVPRAPSSSTLVFGTPEDDGDNGWAAAGWSIHGEECSHVALHVMPEWAEAALRISAEMHEASARLRGHAAAAICGSKGTGKSSFGRLLLNNLLNTCREVAWLDTDCGQPEFTVPGLVSLTLVRKPVYAMPHMHPHEPARAHFIGHLSPEWDPQRYVSAVTDLARWHAVHHGAVPLIVNTCGWIKGLGEDVLGDVLRCSRPGHLIMLQTPNARRNVPPGRFWLEGDDGGIGALALPAGAQLVSIVQLPAVASQAPLGSATAGLKKITAGQARSLSWLNFARRCCSLPLHRSRWTTEAASEAAEALTRHKPFTVGVETLRLQVKPLSITYLAHTHGSGAISIAPQCLHTSVPEYLMGAVLNGALVGLCREEGQENIGSTAECLGVGLVRTFDAATSLLYVLSPVPLSTLSRVNLLQVGRLDLPPELLQSGEVACPYLSSWSISTVGTGAGAIKSRNNLQRAAQAAA